MSVVMDRSILLSVFTLDKFTEPKVPEKLFDVIFESRSQDLGKQNSQEKSKGLVFPFSRSPLQNVSIKNVNILLEADDYIPHSKEIREITIDYKDFKDWDWQPGDTIGILPNNANDDIEELIKILELDDKADTICSVHISDKCTRKNAKIPTYLHPETTPREILRDCLNLKTILKKTFLRSLAEYCSDSEEKKFLKILSSKEGSSFYNDLIIQNRFALVDILKLCRSCKPPFDLIVEHLSRLLPRPYSIANSPLKTNEEITFIYSSLGTNAGVTTKMLKEKSIEKNSSLTIYLRESNSFRYTESNYVENQILIAIGIGLAPFLGFLQHKHYLMNKKQYKPGITWVFVGTTNQKAVIHREEFFKWQSNNVLEKFVETYSRSPTARFHYVQDALEHYSKELVALLLKPETSLYLCADGAQISKSIEIALQNILGKELIINEEESTEMLKDFKRKRKYREDIWL